MRALLMLLFVPALIACDEPPTAPRPEIVDTSSEPEETGAAERRSNEPAPTPEAPTPTPDEDDEED